MTAFLVTVQPNGAHLLSDRAAVDTDGRVTEIVSKVQLFPDLTFAIGVTGFVDPNWIHEDMAAARPATLHDAINALPGIAHAIAGRNRLAADVPPDVTLIAICFHPELGPASWTTATGNSAHLQGWRPGAIHRVRACLDAIDDPAPVLGRSVDVFDPDSFDPATDGVRLMEHCRAIPADPSLWSGRIDHYGIGGGVDLTTAGPSGLVHRRLIDWPDVVGARISPVLRIEQHGRQAA